MSRIHLVLDPTTLEARSRLEERIRFVCAQVDQRTLAEVLDEASQALLNGAFARAGGTEGSLWLLDPGASVLRVVWNSGPNSAKLVGGAEQPLGVGLISMVFATEQSFLENDVALSASHSKRIDTRFGQVTEALIAVPFYLFEDCVGVVSCVKLRQLVPTTTPRFTGRDLGQVEQASLLVGRLIEWHILRRCTGLGDE